MQWLLGFAQGEAGQPGGDVGGFWYRVGGVMLVLVFAAVGLWAYRFWSDVREESTPASEAEILSAFEQARAEGELDDEEYRRIQSAIRDGGTASKPSRSEPGGGETRALG
jgi:uncharacterized membrane protein